MREKGGREREERRANRWEKVREGIRRRKEEKWTVLRIIIIFFFFFLTFRSCHAAISALSLLEKLNRIDVDRVVQNITSCRNSDGGFGLIPGAASDIESGKIFILCNLCHCVGVYYHICNCLVILNAAFACVGTLAIISKLDCIDRDFLGSWLARRQPRFGDVTEIGERSDVSIIFLHILKEFIYYMVIIYIYTYVFLD